MGEPIGVCPGAWTWGEGSPGRATWSPDWLASLANVPEALPWQALAPCGAGPFGAGGFFRV